MPNILIELLKQQAAKDKKKTAAFPSRRRWRPGRRRVGNIYINYYDRGALADGSDVGFSVVPTPTRVFLDVDSGFYSYPYHFVEVSGQTGSLDPNKDMIVNFFGYPPRVQFDDVDFITPLNTHLFLTDPETWAGTYKQIDSVSLYQEYSSTLTSGSDFVSGKGFRVNNDTERGGEITARSSLYFMTSGTGDADPVWANYTTTVSDCKVTTEQDYSADAVDFVLNANCDVFLTPSIMFYWGFAFRDAGGGDREFWLQNGIYRPLPRSTINNALWDDLRTPGTPTFKTGLSTATRDWWHDLAINDPDARCFHMDFNTATPIGGGEWSLGDLGSGTLPRNSDAHYGNVLASTFRPYIAAKLFRMEPGCCLAQIKKSGVWYYVWNTNIIGLDSAQLHWGGFV